MNMDDGGHRENRRHRVEQYRPAQWMVPQHQMKDPNAIKLIALMNERDHAIRERNLALSEKKVALAERDMAMLQRDAAITERNNALIERDNAIASLEFARQNMNNNGGLGCKNNLPSPQQLANAPYDHERGMHISDALPISEVPSPAKIRRPKQPRKDTKGQSDASKTRKKCKKGSEGVNRDKEVSMNKLYGWADPDVGSNMSTFDESTMVVVCSCTGKSHRCYRWGSGGWQSACCTTKLSEYPLPAMPGKRHSRVGGRKMSGSVFTKLLTRLAAEGHDLSMPLDLKDHWAKHGTNGFMTIK